MFFKKCLSLNISCHLKSVVSSKRINTYNCGKNTWAKVINHAILGKREKSDSSFFVVFDFYCQKFISQSEQKVGSRDNRGKIIWPKLENQAKLAKSKIL